MNFKMVKEQLSILTPNTYFYAMNYVLMLKKKKKTLINERERREQIFSLASLMTGIEPGPHAYKLGASWALQYSQRRTHCLAEDYTLLLVERVPAFFSSVT